MRTLAFLLSCALAATQLFGQAAKAAPQVLRVGALGAIPSILDPIRAGLEKDQGISLVYSEMGAADAFAALEADKIDVAVMSTSMEGWVELMAARGATVKPTFEYRHCIVGTDELSVLINPEVLTDASMLVADLDKATLKKLFTGVIRNWKEVGGPDLPVVVLGWNKLQVTAKEFRDKALDGAPYRADQTMLTCASIHAYLDTLGSTKGAIGLGPLAVTRSAKVWSPEQAPRLVRPFTLLLPARSTPAVTGAVVELIRTLQKQTK